MVPQDEYIQLSSLPEDVRKQVLDYIEFLMERREQAMHSEKEVPIPGLAKGKVIIPEDFNAPLDDFKDYM